MNDHPEATSLMDATSDVALLRPEDVARRLQVGRTKVYDLMRAGLLRSVKVGGSRRITPAALAEFVAGLDREPAA